LKAILVTGGAGYIGSHTCVELLDNGYQVIVIDNLSNSSYKSLERVEELTKKSILFYKEDLRNKKGISKIFDLHRIDAVIHFAGLKAVGESVKKPIEYYSNNIVGTINLIEVMQEHYVHNIVFSSSATVYGEPNVLPIRENFPLRATNPYGRSKLFTEEMLLELNQAEAKWNISLLRYFNPVGAHVSGMLGENPSGTPNNLMPYISQVAVGKLDYVSIYGGDYDTKDGTGIRDYIHVVDLAKGHIKALEKFKEKTGVMVYNLGTGKGYSVIEMIEAFAKASGKEVPYKIVERRDGDIPICYADPSKAKKELDWNADYGLEQMCEDTWRWQSLNPDGY